MGYRYQVNRFLKIQNGERTANQYAFIFDQTIFKNMYVFSQDGSQDDNFSWEIDPHWSIYICD